MKEMKRRGLALAGYIIVIIILAVLAAVTLPTFRTLQEDARRSAVIGALKEMRSCIAIWHAKTQRFPTLEELNKSVMPFGIPANPYNGSSAVAAGSSERPDTSAGWIYDSSSGKIYSAAPQTQGAGF